MLLSEAYGALDSKTSQPKEFGSYFLCKQKFSQNKEECYTAVKKTDLGQLSEFL